MCLELISMTTSTDVRRAAVRMLLVLVLAECVLAAFPRRRR